MRDSLCPNLSSEKDKDLIEEGLNIAIHEKMNIVPICIWWQDVIEYAKGISHTHEFKCMGYFYVTK